jgi:hypothetical protein
MSELLNFCIIALIGLMGIRTIVLFFEMLNLFF